MAVEPSLCPRTFQDLAEPEPLIQRPHQILLVIDATDCVRDKILFSNLLQPCTSEGIEANTAKWMSKWAKLFW